MHNKRFEARCPYMKKCSLLSLKKESGVVEAMTIDVAKRGLGVRLNNHTSFKKRDRLLVSIVCMQYSSSAEVQWVNNGDKRLGLKLFQSLYH